MKRAQPATRAHEIAIVARARETMDRLELYLRARGFEAHATRVLGHAAELAPSGTSFVVLFPDDFSRASVRAALEDLGAREVHVVLITSTPNAFEAWATSTPHLRLVLPKPAWAWTITDAIRSWFETTSHRPLRRRPQ